MSLKESQEIFFHSQLSVFWGNKILNREFLIFLGKQSNIEIKFFSNVKVGETNSIYSEKWHNLEEISYKPIPYRWKRV